MSEAELFLLKTTAGTKPKGSVTHKAVQKAQSKPSASAARDPNYTSVHCTAAGRRFVQSFHCFRCCSPKISVMFCLSTGCRRIKDAQYHLLEKNPPWFDLLLKVLFALGLFLGCRELLSTWQDTGASCQVHSSLSF